MMLRYVRDVIIWPRQSPWSSQRTVVIRGEGGLCLMGLLERLAAMREAFAGPDLIG
jgi:hypothetical protein